MLKEILLTVSAGIQDIIVGLEHSSNVVVKNYCHTTIYSWVKSMQILIFWKRVPAEPPATNYAIIKKVRYEHRQLYNNITRQ